MNLFLSEAQKERLKAKFNKIHKGKTSSQLLHAFYRDVTSGHTMYPELYSLYEDRLIELEAKESKGEG